MSSGNLSGAFSICRVEIQDDSDCLNYLTIKWGYDSPEKALASLQSAAQENGISIDELVVVQTIFPQDVSRLD